MFVAIMVAMITVSFYIYYTTSQRQLATLIASQASLTVALEQQTQTIEAIQARYKQQVTALSDLNKSNATMYLEKQRLSDKLMKHDLEELSRRKPGLVETRINNGTKELFRSLTDISTN